jgi:hypothetical protein
MAVRSYSAPLAILDSFTVFDEAMPMMPAFSSSGAPGQGRRSHHSHTTLHTPHGKRERERRLRQIARGQLRAENGLVRSA